MKILVAPYNLLAHYLRCIELVKNISIDAEIIFLKSGKYDSFVQNSGFKTLSETTKTYDAVIEKAESFDFSWINHKSVTNTVESLIHIIETEKPDFIIGDTYLGLRIAARYCKTPLISVFNAYLTHHYNDIRPVPHTHKANKYKPRLSQASWERIIRTVEKLTLRKVHKPFRKIRRSFNLEVYTDLLDEFAGDYNLLCDDPEIFPSKHLPNNYKYCGPLLYSCHDHNHNLLQFLENNKQRETILITMGSTGKLSSLGNLTDTFWQNYNIIITGAEEDKTEHNIYYTTFLNFDDFAPLIDLVICHGGNGTMYQAINKNIAIIAVPTIFEQEWNTYRFEKLDFCKIWYPNSNLTQLYKLVKSQIENHKNNRNNNTAKLKVCLNRVINEWLFH